MNSDKEKDLAPYVLLRFLIGSVIGFVIFELIKL